MGSIVSWQACSGTFEDQHLHQVSTQKYSNILSVIYKTFIRSN